MIKTFDQELSGRISIIMDCGQAGDARLLDDCIRATGSLIFAALDSGHHVEWIDLAHLNLLLIPPFSDGHEILDTLARVPAERCCLKEDRLHAAADRVSKKSAISFVLTEFNQAVRDTIDHLRHHNRVVSVYLPEESKVPDDLSGVSIMTSKDRSLGEFQIPAQVGFR